MANEYTVNGADIRAIFKTYSGYPIGYDTNMQINGTDLRYLFDASSGGDQITYDTNYRVNGTDLRYIFRSSGYVPPTPTPTATPTPTPTSGGPTPTPSATPGGGASINDYQVLGASGAYYRLNSSTGEAQYSYNNSTYNFIEAWLDSGTNSDYEVRATLSSGTTVSTGTLNTWQSLGSSRTWGRTAPFGAFIESVLLIEIRRVSDSVVVTSATITLTADNQ